MVMDKVMLKVKVEDIKGKEESEAGGIKDGG